MEINKNKKVIVYCRSGKRSATAINILEKDSEFSNLYNLKGGINQWAKEVEITRAIAKEFYDVLQDRAESDIIIIGAGPAGLTASRELSLMGYKVFVIEQNN